ncbi:bifunctional DNA-binding transcriptional regulator/O6-methylguanine-DNA methyltransferase Ada [Nitrospirillum iridis]|uniref:methylated-DNA--[protein]-cysteine S-methyltransferase n=1 Tax=Nitrospirillum iridis TaxID=765888 RepID=A0A7X0ECZ9_9PROT|nr:bifunctional DNA-binding transcriptional regulator/O6-methylguanine-DNA methyltransferase Ada [Nitrospirillum iridis]MBB6252223.1 AraC family transcriptional regulator of adaptative response/methylated-DNA-[protein]-cysteine methyltransferase [Nitrospirillum iridis]
MLPGAMPTAANTSPRPTAADADPRWQFLLVRDAAQDGRFVYSVKTTGVYCRPSCPSRLAKPTNVAFHDSCAEAERAGFRPCKRCKPDQAQGFAQRQAQLVADACRAIETAEDAPGLEELASQAGLSPHHFHRVFKAVTGVTPKAYAIAHRARRVRDELARPGATVTTALYDAGFNASSRFYEAADGVLGMRPGDYRAGGTNADIRFAVAQCSLGALLVARSDRGICAITLGDDPDILVRELQDRFPRARLTGDDPAFDAQVAQVVGFVEAPRLGLDLPLDVRGTAFQQRVWQALRAIPAGETASYAQVAASIGAPKAVRAVAQACAANPVAVAVPCHRVVRTDGALSGYRWGVERKRTLLGRERA